MFRNQKLLPAHIGAQGFRHAHAAVCLQVILQKGDKHAWGRHHGVVQRVGQIFCAILGFYADLQADGSVRVPEALRPYIDVYKRQA